MHRVIGRVVESGAFELQDRAEVMKAGERVIFAVADGAGGMAGGAKAADFFINAVREFAESLTAPVRCCST